MADANEVGAVFVSVALSAAGVQDQATEIGRQAAARVKQGSSLRAARRRRPSASPSHSVAGPQQFGANIR
jgi:hypothetical protein